MRRYYILILFYLFDYAVYAQSNKIVSAVIKYPMDKYESQDQAKANAVYKAKIKALASEFGTVISNNNISISKDKNGSSSEDFYSVSMDEVKGEWLKTIDESINIEVINGEIYVNVKIVGEAREIKTANVDCTVMLLRNSTDLRNSTTDFNDGDNVYMYFMSPINGNIVVYLEDKGTQEVYCLLPYRTSNRGAYFIKHDTPYILFSSKDEKQNPDEVEEYTLTCESITEYNVVHVIFSPNNFFKALASKSTDEIPNELSKREFDDWLFRCKRRDKDMITKEIPITIKKK